MARLNESAPAPTPMESIELLKRRFLRQNKEVIRANSDQAVRIRTLEAEQSRLLSENITLREANIHLSHELTKGRSALALENVGNVRHKLEMFAAGLGGLLAELADAQTKLPEPVPVHESAKRRSPKASPGQRWRHGGNLAHLGGDEGRLSPIVEGKYYPRKTLDLADLAILDEHQVAMSDSPDLGPPPVVQYDMGDPIKSSPSPSRSRDLRAEFQENEIRDPFVNLETRKKRRSSAFAKDAEISKAQETHATETKSTTTANDSSEDAKTEARIVKIGGKRKLNMREDDEVRRQPEDFEFTKKNSEERKNSQENSTVVLPIRTSRPAPEMQRVKSSDYLTSKHKKLDASALAPLRKVLGDKSVNSDPMLSPAKVRSREKGEKNEAIRNDPVKKDVAKPRAAARPRSAASNRSKQEVSQKLERVELDPYVSAPQIATISLDPATPALADLLSPMDGSSSSTTGNLVSQDTPEPSDAGARPSRRSRPAVSYAEPKLNVKMRRPGKELVDAVADDKLRKSISLPKTIDTASDQLSTKLDEFPKWKIDKAEPVSPLAPKQAHPGDKEAEAPSNAIADRGRRASVAQETSAQASEQAAAMEDKINAIVNISNRRLSRAREAAGTRSQIGEDTASKAEQNVFDLIETSSPEVSLASHNLTSRTQRRASSVEKLGKSASVQDTGRSNSRRRETMATNASLRGKDTEADESQDEETTSRGARMATRRKSMMV